MSFALVNQAIAQPLPPARRAVLVALADMANHAGACWPSVATIARRACLSVRSVFAHLKALEGVGVLMRRARIGRSSLYTLTMEPATTGQGKHTTTAPTDGPTVPPDQATTAPEAVQVPTPTPAPEAAPVPAVAPVVLTVGSVVQAMRHAGMLGAYECTPLAALVATSASPTDGLSEFTSVAREAVSKGKGFAWVLTVIKARRADRAALMATVPGRAGRDPVLLQIEREAAQAAPPPASIRERLAQLRAALVGANTGANATMVGANAGITCSTP